MRKFAFCLTAMLLCACFCFAQTTVRGKVLDRNNQPIEGASVKEKGTGNGTSTDRDGNYTIKVSGSNAVLVFSGAGLTETERAVTGGGYVEVSMLPAKISMGTVEIVGTRSLRRSATETPVPVDIIPVSKITNTLGQADLNQILQYVAPSFNSNRQTGADGADHVDPATLRGLGPDQTLVLVNGKRWHQSSLVNLFGTRGRGNTGTDLNSIPAASIERIEILRDGASAQYGSDAIAGVINIVLKTGANMGSANVSFGEFMTGRGKSLNDENGAKVFGNRSDGQTIDANLNYGFSLKNDGFVNLTGEYITKKKTFRPNFPTLNPSGDPRRKSGDGSLDNYSFVLNSAFPINSRSTFYAFGGVNQRNSSAYAYTRYAGDSRNVPSIYPDGFDPLNRGEISDRAVSFGVKSSLCGWRTDFNASLGFNKFKYYISNTLNASMGTASPTKFYSGGFQLAQNSASYGMTKSFAKVAKGANLAIGAEVRQDQYKIFKGELNSYKQYPTPGDIPGGAQGFPGFQPGDEANKQRVNYGAYIDGELDASKGLLFSGSLRGEHYSDFGWTGNFKLAARGKITDYFTLRGSISTGFRAPSLPQINFSNTFTNVAAGVISEVVIAPNSGALAQAVGIPALKQETSVNSSIGFTTRPIRDLSITVDGYNINIKDRVILTGYFDQSDPDIGGILAAANIGAAQFFTNSVDTRTKGVDIIAAYSKRFGNSRIGLTLAGNFNKLTIDKIHTVDKLAGREDIYLPLREQYFLKASAPDHKLSAAVDYKLNDFSANVRVTNFSAVDLIDYTYTDVEHNKSKTTTDVSLSYLFGGKFSITLGGSNIFDVYPDNHPDPTLTETGTRWEAIQMGIGGSFFYGKLGVRF